MAEIPLKRSESSIQPVNQLYGGHRASLVEYACRYEVSITNGSKFMAKVKVGNTKTDQKRYPTLPIVPARAYDDMTIFVPNGCLYTMAVIVSSM